MSLQSGQGPSSKNFPSDRELDAILAALPREEASTDFTDDVLRRVRQQPQYDADQQRDAERGTPFVGWFLGSNQGFGLVLAASAVLALVAGLTWSQFVTGADGETNAQVASSEPSPADVTPAAPVRGTPVTTASPRPSSGFTMSPAATDHPTSLQGSRSLALPVGQARTPLEQDYLRLQRELAILRALADRQSPVVGIGSNGQIDYYIDLGEYVVAPGNGKAVNGARAVDERVDAPQY